MPGRGESQTTALLATASSGSGRSSGGGSSYSSAGDGGAAASDSDSGAHVVPTVMDGAPAEGNIVVHVGGEEKNALGTFAGVFLPCILSIFGAILFLRLPWAVGEAGVAGTLLMFAVAGLTVLLTTLSIAAISTNGTMKGGGAYYMISRALGPEFGGAVGLVFFAANSVGVTFYMVSYGSEVNLLLGGDDSDQWAIRLYASVTLLVLLGISMVGASAFAKFNYVVFAVLCVSIVVAMISFFIAPASTADWHTGLNATTFSDNLESNYSTDKSGKKFDFFSVFLIVFPAMTGIMAGANMSGDLADAGKSIGAGTLQAIGVSLVVYASLVFAIGATVVGSRLRGDLYVMQHVCVNSVFVAMGIVASTVSSALGNLVGSGRVLQALARDKLFPFLNPFGWGSKKGDEPRPAMLLTWAIAQAAMFLGDLDMVAGLISGFFLLVYFFTNLACFVLRITGAPNFRPSFRYFSWHTALMGSLLCGFILFVSNPVYASLSIVVLAAAWLYVHYTAPVTEWGDVTQALIFHQVRKYLLRLDERKQHVKFWRPSVLLICQDPSPIRSANLIDFCNNLKKGGIYVLGSILVLPTGDIATTGRKLTDMRKMWLKFIEAARLKAFTETTVAQTPRAAYQNLMLASGVGGMKPNTVVWPFCETLRSDTTPDSPFSSAVGMGGGTTTPITEGAQFRRKGVHSDAAREASVKISELSRHDGFGAAGGGGDGVLRSAATPTVAEDEAKAGSVESGSDGDDTILRTRSHSTVSNSGEVIVQDVREWVNVCRDTLFLGKHLLVVRNFAQLDKALVLERYHKSKKAKTEAKVMRVDVWVSYRTRIDEESVALQLQLAHVLQRTDIWSECTALRIVVAVLDETYIAQAEREVEDMKRRLRFAADVRVIPILGGRVRPIAESMYKRHKAGEVDMLTEPPVINELVRHNSEHTCVLFMPLPELPATDPSEAQSKLYHTRLESLTRGLPPVVLVAAAPEQAVVTDSM